MGDKYIPLETPVPATQDKPKKKTKKQKRRAVRRKTTPLPLKRVFPEDCSNTSQMARVSNKLPLFLWVFKQSRRRQQTEELPRQSDFFLKESAKTPADPHDHAQGIYTLPNEEEDTYEDTDVVKKIKLKRYAKLPDE